MCESWHVRMHVTVHSYLSKCTCLQANCVVHSPQAKWAVQTEVLLSWCSIIHSSPSCHYLKSVCCYTIHTHTKPSTDISASPDWTNSLVSSTIMHAANMTCTTGYPSGECKWYTTVLILPTDYNNGLTKSRGNGTKKTRQLATHLAHACTGRRSMHQHQLVHHIIRVDVQHCVLSHMI